jgi:hypothetical protein
LDPSPQDETQQQRIPLRRRHILEFPSIQGLGFGREVFALDGREASERTLYISQGGEPREVIEQGL